MADSEWKPNFDVDGLAVVIANIVVSFCSRILVTWSSPEDIEVGIKASLAQFYPIILSMLLSINRDQLRMYDAACALNLTSPPVITYLAVSSICDLFGAQTGLYDGVRSHRHIVRVFTALTLPFWFALSLTFWFAPRAFTDSNTTPAVGGFRAWFRYSVVETYFFQDITTTSGWIYASSMASVFFLCLFRRRSQVMKDFRAHREEASKPWVRWRVPWTFAKFAWRTVNCNHMWWMYSLFAYLDVCWTFWVVCYTIGASNGYGYVLSYGQLLSLFAAVPPLIPVAKLIYASRWDLLHFLRRLPRLFLVEVWYLVTGIELDPPAQNGHLPLASPRKPPTRRATI